MLRHCLAASLALISWMDVASAHVDESCSMAEAVLCATERAEDARAADELVEPTLENLGWSRACYSVMYLSDDDGGSYAISITLHGPALGSAPACMRSRDERAAASVQKLRQVVSRLRKVLSSASPRIRRNTGLLQVTNGRGGEAQVALPQARR